MTVWLGIIFIVGLVGLLAIDMGLLHRKSPRTPTIQESLLWTLFWVVLALAFNIGVYFAYGRESDAALQFFTGYLLEKSLSLDNIFVIALIFNYFKVPSAYQHRALTWGVCGAVIFRLIMILFGIQLILRFHWLLYILGAFLIYSAMKMLIKSEGDFDPNHHFLVRLVRKVLPVSQGFHRDHFFTYRNGFLMATPLLIALIEIEAFDLLFAFDSIPAIFAITLDPFIVFTSNVFAILGLRTLYFALAGLLEAFRFLKYSLALVLLFIGCKMTLSYVYEIPLMVSLLVVISLLLGGVAVSVSIKSPSHHK